MMVPRPPFGLPCGGVFGAPHEAQLILKEHWRSASAVSMLAVPRSFFKFGAGIVEGGRVGPVHGLIWRLAIDHGEESHKS